MLFDFAPSRASIDAELVRRNLTGTWYQIALEWDCIAGEAASPPLVAVRMGLPYFPRCTGPTPDEAVALAVACLDITQPVPVDPGPPQVQTP